MDSEHLLSVCNVLRFSAVHRKIISFLFNFSLELQARFFIQTNLQAKIIVFFLVEKEKEWEKTDKKYKNKTYIVN